MSYDIPSTSGIYRIVCTANKKFYLGSSNNLHQRWFEHRGYLRNNRHHSILLQRAWNKYGETSFVFEILEWVLPMFLLEREQYWLDKLKPMDPRKGYNISSCARAGFFGRTHSEQTREKLRAASTGVYHDPEEHACQMKTLSVTSPSGEVHLVRGVKRFCREHNLVISCLMRVARGERRHHKGWTARLL